MARFPSSLVFVELVPGRLLPRQVPLVPGVATPQLAAVGHQEGLPELLAPEHVDQEVGRRVDAGQEVGQAEIGGKNLVLSR